MHTILGAGGVIGRLLAEELIQQGQRVRLVSRRAQPHSQNELPYLFDSTRFTKAFSLAPTPYVEGIAQTVLATRRSA